MSDRPAHREALDPEIEITSEMIEAGDHVVREFDYECWDSMTGERWAELLTSVYSAMRRARQS